MKTSGAILIFLLAACQLSFGRDEESLEQLIARAESAQLGQQPEGQATLARLRKLLQTAATQSKCRCEM